MWMIVTVNEECFSRSMRIVYFQCMWVVCAIIK